MMRWRMGRRSLRTLALLFGLIVWYCPQPAEAQATFIQITSSTGSYNISGFPPSINADGTRIAFFSSSDLTGGNTDVLALARLREEVADVAASALPVYLAKISKERISEFGFQSPEELPKAILLPPIPLFMPVRKVDLLNRGYVEKSLGERPITWIIPISVGGRIACLIHIDSINGKKPEAVMFGDNYRAKRLESGLRLFGWPHFSRWQDLRFLSFYEPTVDLLLVQEGSDQWRWLNLKGTLNATPIPLDANGVGELLGIIKNTKTNKSIPD